MQEWWKDLGKKCEANVGAGRALARAEDAFAGLVVELKWMALLRLRLPTTKVKEVDW
jgi:hypothetical protein